MAEPSSRWLDTALRRQAQVATAVAAAFCAATLLGFRFGANMQIAILLAGIVAIGFPHGAFDHYVGRQILARRLGRLWWIPFGSAYLGLAGLVWIGWMIWPSMTLAGFLAASVVHFGLGDIQDGLAPAAVPRAVSVTVYGCLPILLPMALHARMAAPVLAALAATPVPVMQNALHATLWLLPLWAAGFSWIMLAALHEQLGIAERLSAAASCTLLPPLLSFGLYFCTGHSVRHTLRLGARYNPHGPRVALRWLAQVIVPASLICIAGLVMLALGSQETVTDVMAPTFRIIAALTLPHMVVTALLDRGHGGTQDQGDN